MQKGVKHGAANAMVCGKAAVNTCSCEPWNELHSKQSPPQEGASGSLASKSPPQYIA